MNGQSPTPDTEGFTHWLAPAKINLFLHITGRRDDGYHNLQTIFQFVTLFDEIAIRPTTAGRITRVTQIKGVSEAEDLTIRAARLLQQHSSTPHGADIKIRKHIPMGGGLGGGSSDAATVLMALNELWNTNLPKADLQSLGLQLGADIPVFIGGHAAWADGVGEQLTEIEPSENWVLIINPHCHVPTAEIFNHPNLTRDCPPKRIRASLSPDMVNVCETLVRKLYPEVDQCLQWLEQFAPARLSGTGGCVFALFPDQSTATATLNLLPSRWQGELAKSINQHPFYQR